MNNNRYRVIFNRSRGQLMAVGETATAQGKSAGDRPDGAAPPNRSRVATAAAAGRFALVPMFAALAAVTAPQALAQVIADPTAPANQRPTVLVDATGRPLINVQTPSTSGVSRNTYRQFDVQSNGVVLNNTRASNPWLATGEARVILNEVNSTSPSQLKGVVTVNGANAQVVIANPAGIKVDGAYFVNANRATLTTGTPVVTNGALTGFDVRQGTVEISGKGLSYRALTAGVPSFTEILSRALVVTAPLKGGGTLSVVTGTQNVDYATGLTTPLAGTGSQPALAIDTSLLGGMYASKISLIATEAGVGVRNAGTILGGIVGGEVFITADGRLDNTGAINGTVVSAATVTGNIDNSGSLGGLSLTAVNAGADLNQVGQGSFQWLNGASNVVLSANRDVNVTAGAKISATNTATVSGVTTASQLAVSAGRNINLAAGSSLTASSNLQLSSDGAITANNATLSSQTADVKAVAAQGINLSSTNVTGKLVHIETGAPFVETSARIDLNGGAINSTQQTAIIASGDLFINGPGTAPVASAGNLHVQAGKNLTLTGGSKLTATGQLNAVAGEALALWGNPGSSAATGTVASVSAGGDVSLTGGSVGLSGSSVSAGGALSIAATTGDAQLFALANAGGASQQRAQLIAGKDVAVSAYTGNIYAPGVEITGQNVSVVAAGNTSILPATNLVGADRIAMGSMLTAREDLSVGSIGAGKSVIVNGSTLVAGGKVRVSADGYARIGDVIDLKTAAGATSQTSSSVRSYVLANDIGIQAGTVDLVAASVRAGLGHINVASTKGDTTVANGVGVRAELISNGNTALHANNTVNLWNPLVDARWNLAVTSAAGSINTSYADLRAQDVLSFASKGNQTHANGYYQGGAVSIYNESGALAINSSAVKSTSIANPALASVSGKMSIESGAALLVDSGTTFSAGTDFSLVAGSGDITLSPFRGNGAGLLLTTNQISAGRDISLQAKTGLLTVAASNTYKLVRSAAGVGMESTGALRSVLSGVVDATLVSKGNLTLAGAAVSISGAQLNSAGKTTVVSGGTLAIAGRSTAVTNYVPAARVAEMAAKISDVGLKISEIENDATYKLQSEMANGLYACVNDNGYTPDQCLQEHEWTLNPAILGSFQQKLSALRAEKSEYEIYSGLLKKAAYGKENSTSSISANQIEIVSGGGVSISGTKLTAKDTVLIQTTGVLPAKTDATTAELTKPVAIEISGVSDYYNYGVPNSGNEAWIVASRPTEISGTNGVKIQALGQTSSARLVLNNSNVTASAGTVRLDAAGDIRLEAGQEELYQQSTNTYKTGRWYNRKTVTETAVRDKRSVSPVTLAGQAIEVQALGNLDIYSTEFLAPAGNIKLVAADVMSLLTAPAVDISKLDVQKKRSFIGIQVSKSNTSTTRQVSEDIPAVLVARNISTASGGNTVLKGTVFETSLGGAQIAVGVGPNARADAQIILEGAKKTVTESTTKENNYVVWQRQVGAGSTVETMVLPKFTGPVAPTFSGPVLAQIPAGEFKTQIQTLSQQPGMEYLNTLAARTDVKWEPVKLAYDQWSYKQEGLTPAGAALLAVAVSLAIPANAGAAFFGVSGGGVPAAMANAAFMSLSSQAAITLVNNKGNIGKTLNDLARSDTVKATLAAAITAGVLDKIGGTATMQELAKPGAGFSDKLTYNLINASGRALTNAAFNGGSLEDALRGALVGGLVDTAHGAVASQIKGLENEYIVHKLAHALAGCAAGAAANGTCKDGAIGAAVGEMVAHTFKDQKPGAYASKADWDAYDAKVLGYSKLIAGATSAYAGGNAQTAISTAETAVRNNFLTFNENQLRKQAAQACLTGNAQACADEKRLNARDLNRDEKVRQVCSAGPASQECRDWRDLALLARSTYGTDARFGRNSVLDLVANGGNSDIEELRSIQKLIATTPYAYSAQWKPSPTLVMLAEIAVGLTPVFGDLKSFYDAKDPFDYTLAIVGALGPVGDGAAATIRAAKAAHQAGNAAEASRLLNEAAQVTKNHVNGWVFEGSGLQGMGLQKNADRVTAVTRAGESITIVPDATIGGIKGTFVEFKNVINITDSSQFRGYAAAGQPIILVVSPRTETISKTVWDMVTSNGKVYRFDPAAGVRTELLRRPGA